LYVFLMIALGVLVLFAVLHLFGGALAGH
jgi:hypothetical protein